MTTMTAVKPLIKNARSPGQLFTEGELTTIRQAMSCMYTMKRTGVMPKMTEQEIQHQGALLKKARFNGYYPRGIDKNNHVVWSVLAQPQSERIRRAGISIEKCQECERKFHSPVDPGQPLETICPRCITASRLAKIPKPVPLKTMPKTKMTAKEQEARKAYLLRQTQGIL